jgi:hypothetical protein
MTMDDIPSYKSGHNTLAFVGCRYSQVSITRLCNGFMEIFDLLAGSAWRPGTTPNLVGMPRSQLFVPMAACAWQAGAFRHRRISKTILVSLVNPSLWMNPTILSLITCDYPSLVP